MSKDGATKDESLLQQPENSNAQSNPVSENDSEERNLPTVSSRATRSGRQYLFIDRSADRRSSNEAIRVHVMRESHRARRQLRGLKHSGSAMTQDHITILSPGTSTLQTRASSASEGTSFDADVEDDETRITDDLAASNARSITDLRLLAAQYTLSLSPEEQRTVALCQDDAAALSAFMALAVMQKAGVGTDVPQILSAELESQALAMLRSRFARFQDTGQDETILTIALLSRLERYRNNEEVAGFHEAALQQLIQSRGGTDALANRNVELAQSQKSAPSMMNTDPRNTPVRPFSNCRDDPESIGRNERCPDVEAALGSRALHQPEQTEPFPHLSLEPDSSLCISDPTTAFLAPRQICPNYHQLAKPAVPAQLILPIHRLPSTTSLTPSEESLLRPTTFLKFFVEYATGFVNWILDIDVPKKGLYSIGRTLTNRVGYVYGSRDTVVDRERSGESQGNQMLRYREKERETGNC